MDLSELQAALLKNQKATQSMAGLDERYSRANALRDSAGPQMDQYGQVSPLAVLANTVRRSRGRQGVRETTPLRDEARGTIADTNAALQGNTLRAALEKETRERGTYQNTLLTDTQKRNLAREKNLRESAVSKQDLASNEGEGETWTNGKKDVAVVYDAENKPTLLDGSEVPGDYYPKSTSTSDGGSLRGKAISPQYLGQLADDSSQVRKVGRVVNNFKDSYIQPTGFGLETPNKWLVNASTADILKYSNNPELDENAKQAALWWADWKMTYELLERHKLFGATLTNNEMSSWKEAVNLLMGMEPVKARQRIGSLFDDLHRDLANESSSLRMLRKDSPNEVAALDRAMSGGGYQYDSGKDNYIYGGVSSEVEIAPEQEAAVLQSLSPEERTEFEGLSPESQKAVIQELLSQ